MKNALTYLIQAVIMITIIICFTSCQLGSVDVSAIVPLVGQSQPSFNLPLKIKWISPLYPDEDKIDYNRPVEQGQPVIDKNRVFVGSHFGNFLCLDRKTGEIIWKFKAFGGIESVPVINNDAVIFGDSDGEVYSLRKSDGYANWTFKVQGEIMGNLIVHENILLFTTTFNRIYALEADSGKWLWTQKRSLPDGFTVRGVSSPVTDGEFVYAGLADGYLICVDIKRGKEVWKNLLVKGDRLIDVDTTPVLVGDLIYAAAFDGSLFCMKKENGEVVWKFEKGGVHRISIFGERIYYSDSQGFVRCLDEKSGKEIWNFDVRNEDKKRSLAKSLRRKIRVPSRPIRFGQYIVIVSNVGFLYVLDPQDGKMLWRYLPGYGVSSELVSTNDSIYFLSNSAMIFRMVPNPKLELKY